MASILTVDFSKGPDVTQHPSGITRDGKPKRPAPRDADGKLLTPKQIRARARRRVKRNEVISEQEMEYLYRKPVSEWDLEELAHGRPRNEKGHFRGPNPSWISAVVHEEAMAKYTAAVKTSMRGTTVDALEVIKELINDDNVDEKGKPIVPPGTKLEAAKFLIEHVVGKPTQRIESDVSVKLQGILGQVLVNPADMGQAQTSYNLGHYPGLTMAMGEAQERTDDDEFID